MIRPYKKLRHGQQIAVDSFEFRPKITVGTLEGCSKPENLKESIERAKANNHPFAWTIRSASCITADYPGKNEEIRKKNQAYNEAVRVENDEIVIIEGRKYKVVIVGENFSDPIHFKSI